VPLGLNNLLYHSMDPNLFIYIIWNTFVSLLLFGDVILVRFYGTSITMWMVEYPWMRAVIMLLHIIPIVFLYEHIINEI